MLLDADKLCQSVNGIRVTVNRTPVEIRPKILEREVPSRTEWESVWLDGINHTEEEGTFVCRNVEVSC